MLLAYVPILLFLIGERTVSNTTPSGSCSVYVHLRSARSTTSTSMEPEQKSTNFYLLAKKVIYGSDLYSSALS